MIVVLMHWIHTHVRLNDVTVTRHFTSRQTLEKNADVDAAFPDVFISLKIKSIQDNEKTLSF